MDFYLNQSIIREFENVISELNLKKKFFIEKINNTDTSTISKTQLINYINDIKNIIDPIKNSIESIDHLLNNKDFLNNESLLLNNKILKALILMDYFT
jgi:hypothetical protein